MFKDYDKYLITSLKVYLFVLLIIVILKIVGFNYFGFDINNPTILKINDFILKNHLENVYYTITLYIYTYLILSIICKDNSKKMKFYVFVVVLVSIFLKMLDNKIANTLIIFIIEFMFLMFVALLYNKFKNIKEIIKRTIITLLLNTLFQVISLVLRSIQFYNINLNVLIYMLLDFDYILMLLIFQSIFFNQGGEKLCGMEVGLSSLKKINLKKSLKKLQKRFQNNLKKYNKMSKEEKLTLIIYIILSIIWNTLTILLILFVAFLNDTLIECLFILVSFWLSKRSFGKAFHFDSMIVCFIVSNLSYYSLNRITSPLGISIIVPILLGVGLSYFTSKFVKRKNKYIYRGMPIEEFDLLILKLVEKNSIKYKICYDFYINKDSDLSLSFKYNYSVPGIRKIRERINKKLKNID